MLLVLNVIMNANEDRSPHNVQYTTAVQYKLATLTKNA
jgi:hypothetical protein